jgi:hypothetical protein
MRTEEQVAFFSGAGGDIKNCQVVEFSAPQGKITAVKSSNPHLAIPGVWTTLERKTFSPTELLTEVETYPHMVKE